jgi:Flp pilus assembly protein TadG
MRVRRKRAERRGTAAVEFVVVLPFLVPLLIGLWEVGRLVEVMQVLNNAARDGGRQIATGNVSISTAQTEVVNLLARNGITATASQVSISNVTNPSRNDPTTCNQMDQWHVQVQIPFNSVRWILLSQITNITTLTGQADWFSMKDVPISVNTTIPNQ